MPNAFCLDEYYSTTRLVTTDQPINVKNKEDQFESVLFLPEGKGRKGEGGLRTKGYFKKSYDYKPLISIITVIYNGEKYLEETIQSIINQTYDNVEYIIIDGGSTDGTLDIIKKYEDKIDYWVSESDNGIYDAMNKGLQTATGEIIGLLNADDTYINQFVLLNVITNFLQKKCDLLHAKIVQRDNNNKIITTVGTDLQKDELLLKMRIAHPSVFISKKIYLQYGLFNTQYKIAADYDMMLRIWGDIDICFVNDVLVAMRVGGVSNIMVTKSYLEARKITIHHGMNTSIANLNCIKEIFKHRIIIQPLRKIFSKNVY